MKQLILASLFGLLATAAPAATLFENTFAVSASGNCTFQCNGGRSGAENFTLTETATVTDVAFGGLTISNAYSNGTDFSGVSVAWGLHSSAVSTPGTTLASGTAGVSGTRVRTVGSFHQTNFSVDILDTVLAAGSYWVSFKVTAPSNIFWARSESGDSIHAHTNSAGTWLSGNPDSPNGWVFSVSSNAATPVSSVPLPAGLPLLAAGLMGLMALRRRR